MAKSKVILSEPMLIKTIVVDIRQDGIILSHLNGRKLGYLKGQIWNSLKDETKWQKVK